MHRLFVAIRPPSEIRSQLAALVGDIEGARWQDDAQLHLTLRYIGNVDRRMANDVAEGLGRIVARAPEMQLSGVGTFAAHGHIDTLWAGVAPRDPLEDLHRKIDRALVSLGFPPESRAYVPHITIARFGKRSRGIEAFVGRHAALASAVFTSDHFTLYESHLGSGGPNYEEVVRYAFA